MKKPLITFFVFLSFLPVFAFRAKAQEAESGEIEKWIKEAQIDVQKEAIFNYTYLLKVSYKKDRKLGLGRKFTRTYEAILPSRFNLTKVYRHPLILIDDSEREVTREEIEFSRRDIARELERAETAADSPANAQADESGYWAMRLKANEQRAKVDISKILEISNFSNLQRKQFDNREVISIDFSPKIVVIMDDALAYMSKIEGHLWIDSESKRIIRMEGFPIGTFDALRDKPDAERETAAVFLFTQTRVPEGFWFPNIVRLDFTGHPNIFDTVKLEFSFSNYRKATTDVKSLNIETPKEAKKPDESKNTDTAAPNTESTPNPL